VEDPETYYTFSCLYPGGDHGKDFRNGILTYNTLDNSTTYWVHFKLHYHVTGGAGAHGGTMYFLLGGYNKNGCYLMNGTTPDLRFYETSYEDCLKVRDGK